VFWGRRSFGKSGIFSDVSGFQRHVLWNSLTLLATILFSDLRSEQWGYCSPIEFSRVAELGFGHCRMLCFGDGRQSEADDWVFWRSQSLPFEK